MLFVLFLEALYAIRRPYAVGGFILCIGRRGWEEEEEQLLAAVGNAWQTLAAVGNGWQPLAAVGSRCQGKPWQPLKTVGSRQRPLATICSR